MPVKKHSVEQIIAKLREIEKLTAQGMSIPLAANEVCRRVRLDARSARAGRRWNQEYNTEGPHRGLGFMTPLAYARSHNVAAK